MCLALPARVVDIADDGLDATVALGEINKQVSLALVPDVAPGDYVLVHVGYALNRISAEEAERTLVLFAEAGLEPGSPP